MFKFLKDKLKGVISRISRKAEEEVKLGEIKEEPIGKQKEEIHKEAKKIIKEGKKETAALKEEIKNEEQRIEEIFEIESEKEEIKEEAQKPETREEPKGTTEKRIEKHYEAEEGYKAEEPEKMGFFSRLKEKITTTKISEEKFEDLFSDLELILMENNVALEVIEKIKSDLKQNLVNNPIKRTKIEETVRSSLKNSIGGLFNVQEVDLLESIRQKKEKPFVIAFFGINGSGKTTSIAKIADMLKKSNFSCILAASDTFRAASIEQLQHHADKLGIKMIKHDYGSDPAAVSFDAIKHAKAKNIDAVLIDTAGRLHSNTNLMDELKKVVKVAKPDLRIFVGESIAGNDCIEQAQRFNEAVGIDGIILTKADIDEKGGASISVSYVTKKPIMYLGMGQEYNDLKEFQPKLIVEGLGL